ncbi:MAP kinase kinase (MEK) [Tulasnella sp. 427]|nr:MAP kinase kinase (MEK) [Tulasnella sp. 427]
MSSSPSVGTSGTVRKKRNFKALQLDVSAPPAASPPPQQPIVAPAPAPVAGLANKPAAQRSAPEAPSGTRRKKPPTLDVNKSKVISAGGPVNGAGGANGAGATRQSSRASYHTQLTEQISNLDLNSGKGKIELRQEDLKVIGELGQGNGGTVAKVMHVPTKTLMAKKVVLIDAKPAVRKQILRELQIMHDCNSKYIVSFHGAFVADPHICICMEYMDKGSLDGIYKRSGAIDIEVVGVIALAVLEGLTYLYDVHRIIHRDIKPSNMLCNSKGEIKICDFGVSGELINSIADTFVGTSTYMSPERIQGAQYSVKSDVWSLGISLIELALGRFPFAEDDGGDSDFDDFADLQDTLSPSNTREGLPPPRSRTKKDAAASKKDKRKSKGVSLQGGGMTMSILELLQHIVNEPAPRLTPAGAYPKEADDFIDACLLKDPERRPTPKELLKYEWIVSSSKSNVNLEAWAATV